VAARVPALGWTRTGPARDGTLPASRNTGRSAGYGADRPPRRTRMPDHPG